MENLGLWLLAGALALIPIAGFYLSFKAEAPDGPAQGERIDDYLDRLAERQEIDESQVW